jgi:hypothetical protein
MPSILNPSQYCRGNGRRGAGNKGAPRPTAEAPRLLRQGSRPVQGKTTGPPRRQEIVAYAFCPNESVNRAVGAWGLGI